MFTRPANLPGDLLPSPDVTLDVRIHDPVTRPPLPLGDRSGSGRTRPGFPWTPVYPDDEEKFVHFMQGIKFLVFCLHSDTTVVVVGLSFTEKDDPRRAGCVHRSRVRLKR